MVSQLIQKILQNNLAGVYANLVNEGYMLPGGTPSMADIIGVIELQLRNSNNSGLFLIKTFDVVVDSNGLYAAELYAMSSAKGKTLGTMLAEQLSLSMANENPVTAFAAQLSGSQVQPYPWATLLIATLAIIGAIVIGRFLYRLVAKIIN